MGPHRRPNEKNVAPETHESQPSPNDRTAEEPKTAESQPASDREIASQSTAEGAPAEAMEPADKSTALDSEPRAAFEVAGATNVDDGPADVPAVEPASTAADLGAERENEPDTDELRLEVSPSSAPFADGLSQATSDVVAPSWSDLGRSSASDASEEVFASPSPPVDASPLEAVLPGDDNSPGDLLPPEVASALETGFVANSDRALSAVDDSTRRLVEIPTVRPGDSIHVVRGPGLYDRNSEQPAVRYLAELDEPSDGALPTAAPSSEADFSPRTQVLLSPTSDGGPPLARPMVLVNLPDARTLRIREEALAAAATRDETTLDKIAEAKVDHAFWVRACHERAVWGNY